MSICALLPIRRCREGNAVMVCTDSAARGLDIRGISHVIQAEFSMSAVDFLHRAGRTARAGAKGRMTSLYTEADAPLANAIRSAIDKGLPVVGSPSTKFPGQFCHSASVTQFYCTSTIAF